MRRIRRFIVLGLLLLLCVMGVKTMMISSLQKSPPAATPFDMHPGPALQRLAAALQFRTISTEDADDWQAQPFLDFHLFLRTAFPVVHERLEVEVVEDYSLVMTWTGQNPELDPILLLAHIDVVPIEDAGSWKWPPFLGHDDGEFIWGRGALDNKSPLLGSLEAVTYLLEEGFQPQRTVLLAFGADEEVGGVRGAQPIAQLLASRYSNLALVLDEGGAIVQGVIPGIKPPVALIGIAEKGFCSIRLYTETEGGHSSMPPQQTAVGIISAALAALEQHEFDARLTSPVETFLRWLAPEMPLAKRFVLANLWLTRPFVIRSYSKSRSTRASVQTSTAVTMVQGGVKDNVLPRSASGVVNFRILPGETIEDVLDHVRRVVDEPRIEVELLGFSSMPSPESDLEGPMFVALQDVIHQAFPDALVAPYLVVGATDSRHFADLSRRIYRFSPIRVSEDELATIHGTNERIGRQNYSELIRFYTLVLRSLAGPEID